MVGNYQMDGMEYSFKPGRKHAFFMSPYQAKLWSEAAELFADITYTSNKDFPYLLNMVVFNPTTVHYQAVGRVLCDKQDGVPNAIKNGKELINILVDFDELVEKLIRGCSAHWMRSVNGVSKILCQSKEEEQIFKALGRCIESSIEKKEDVMDVFNVLSKVVLDEIRAKINSADIRDDQRNRMKFDFDQCQAAIYAWKAHLVRTVLQEEAKQAALNNLDSETCLIIVDWAMKFLPLKFRENMCEFFGKRGRSWHVSAVVTKKDGKFEVKCFVHILNSCTQDSYAIASIFDHLFRTIKAEYPSINKAYLRSDNAGCYHNGPLLLCLDKIDMKRALESYGGLKGCRAAVVEIDASKHLHEAKRRN
ncbi:hypothetical protein AC249_AIPGENE16437 [Exaiptasia diaphana]|nr:hypothetical protein AC249_AIPGENE16437 [Exaiptasia diaphana]